MIPSLRASLLIELQWRPGGEFGFGRWTDLVFVFGQLLSGGDAGPVLCLFPMRGEAFELNFLRRRLAIPR